MFVGMPQTKVLDSKGPSDKKGCSCLDHFKKTHGNEMLMRAASNIHEAFENCVASVVAQGSVESAAGRCSVCHHQCVRYLCDLNVQQANGGSSGTGTIAVHTDD